MPARWHGSSAYVAAAWIAAAMLAVAPAAAADRFFVYDMTTSTTFTGVFLAPAGTVEWGANQALNDKDKSVEPSERLAIKDIARGKFDVKLVDQKGRTCIKKGVDLTKDTTFDVRDADLADCK